MSTSDRFNIPCPGCGTQVAVSTAHIGKKGRCPQCKTVFPIVAPAPAAASLGLQPMGSALPNPYGQSAPMSAFGPAPGYGQPAAYGGGGPSVFDNFGQPSAKSSDDELRLAPDNSNPYASPMGSAHVQETFQRLG